MDSLFNKEEYDIDREEWLEEGDKELSQEELEEQLSFYRHLLGLCDYGIQVVKEDSGEAISKSSRFYIIKCNCERVLVHELLHVLLKKRDWINDYMFEQSEENRSGFKDMLYHKLTERIVFQLTNALLRLRYKE